MPAEPALRRPSCRAGGPVLAAAVVPVLLRARVARGAALICLCLFLRSSGIKHSCAVYVCEYLCILGLGAWNFKDGYVFTCELKKALGKECPAL